MLLRVGMLVLALCGIALLLAVVEYLPTPERIYFWDVAYDTGHILIFGLMTVALLLMGWALLTVRFVGFQYIGAIASSISIGLAVEYWQKHHGRTAEWIDVLNDLVGIVAFAAFFAIFDLRLEEPRQSFRKRRWLFLAGVVSLIIGIYPFWKVVRLYQTRRHAFPSLVEFGEPWDQKLLYAQNSTLTGMRPPDEWSVHDETADWVGRIESRPGRYPGFVMMEPHPDWTGYKTFEFDVLYLGETERHFVLRVHDAFHNNDVKDRFNKSYLVKPGFQTIRVPLSEIKNGAMTGPLDMRRVSGFVFFTVNLAQPVTYYLGNIRLSE